MGVGRFNSTHNAHARYHVTVGGGYKITTYLESETHSFLPTTQLLSGYDDNINGRLLSRALPVVKRFQAGQNSRIFPSPPELEAPSRYTFITVCSARKQE